MMTRYIPAIKQLADLVALFALVSVSPAWPIALEERLPGSAYIVDLGENLSINGQAIRVVGFVSPQSPEELNDWFRRQPSGGYSERRIGERHILSNLNGTLLTTVEIEPAPAGSAGWIALSNLRDLRDSANELNRGEYRPLAMLISDSRVLSLTSSQDRAVVSHQLVIENGKTIAANRKWLIEVMGVMNMKIERETDNSGRLAKLGWEVLQFVGGGSEATAVIDARVRGQTSVVLNIEIAKRVGQ